jgi:23S rRNA U2552 (ribose-2'-O)-methylase RlmE/FtsJ
MSYYNLSSVLDSKLYKKISFSLHTTNKKDLELETQTNETLPITSCECVTTTYISNSLFDFLSRFKEQIELSAEAWDTIKKYTNPYEFIHTIIPGSKLSVSKIKPLSRSFYKMLELWKMFKLGDSRESIQTFHLAEGPGGFIEATSFLRKNIHDSYYGMTLINNDPGCPGWKKSHQFLEANKNVRIITGADETGNLLHKANYLYCVDKFKNSMHIITADGGIDVSNDFNKQEELVSKLIVSEVIYAITMQKKGGHFILKIFDIFSKLTIDILYILTRLYAEVYITKPFTSRLANSEKYIVCKNFLLTKGETQKFIDVFTNEFEKLMHYDNIVSILHFEHEYYFLNKIEEINIIMGQKQLENIITTLNIMGSRNNHDKIDSLKKTNIQKCISWCDKYDIPCIKLLSSNNIFLSGVYDDNTNTASGSIGSIGSIGHSSFKRNTFLKNKNHTHKNTGIIIGNVGNNANNTTKKYDNIGTISNENIHIQPLPEPELNLVSRIMDDIIESVSRIGDMLVVEGKTGMV